MFSARFAVYAVAFPAAILLAGLCGNAALAVQYELSIPIRPGTVIDGHTVTGFDRESPGPAISPNGQIVAEVSLAERFGHALVTTNRVVVAGGDVIGGVEVPGVDEEDISFAVNDLGQVVYTIEDYPFGGGLPGDGAAVLDLQLVAAHGITVEGVPFNGAGIFITAINNSGSAVFEAFTSDQSRLLASSDRIIVRQGDVFRGHEVGSFRSALINESGTVAFDAFAQHAPSGTSRIIVIEGGPVITEGDTIGGFTLATGPTLLALDDAGEPVFAAGLDTGETGIFKADQLIAAYDQVQETMIDGLTVTRIHDLIANPAGDVVLLAALEEGDAVFVNDALLLRTGDVIQGRTITNFPDAPAMSRRGDLAFLADFDDGTRGVVLATVPEPGALSLLATGLAAILTRRRRHGR